MALEPYLVRAADVLEVAKQLLTAAQLDALTVGLYSLTCQCLRCRDRDVLEVTEDELPF